MTVNKMSAKDVPAAAALDRLLFSAECWTEQDFYDSLNDPTRLFWVACEGETLLGCCGLQTVFEDGDVLTVGVHPDHRRKGVGSALMREMLHAFAARGGQRLFLEVRASNRSAAAMYEKFGFRQIGCRKNYYQQPTEDGLVYTLEVDS